MAQTAFVVTFEGEIGAGKTTLLALLVSEFAARNLKAVVIPEPVDEWEKKGILKEFYTSENRKQSIYIFQTFVFVTRLIATIEIVEKNPDADVFLLERSVLTDRYIFVELLREEIGKDYVEMYERWWGLWNKIMPIVPERFVYLKPTLETCQARVQTRARVGEIGAAGERSEAEGQSGVSFAYQKRLRRVHEAFLQGLHSEEFPNMPPRPFKIEDVVVVEGPLIDDDFSCGPAAEQIAKHTVNKLLGTGARAEVLGHACRD